MQAPMKGSNFIRVVMEKADGDKILYLMKS